MFLAVLIYDVFFCRAKLRVSPKVLSGSMNRQENEQFNFYQIERLELVFLSKTLAFYGKTKYFVSIEIHFQKYEKPATKK